MQRLSGLLLCVAVAAGCGKPGVGDPCKADADCPSGLCLGATAGFPNGYCSTDCRTMACGDGQSCQPVGTGDDLACLRGCRSAGDCHDGTQCYEGACRAPCQSDDDCGSDGYRCDGGSCVERPGGKIGDGCASDGECSSQACIAGHCARSCSRETACGDGETCVLDRLATRVRGTCVPVRSATTTSLGACGGDGECQRGTCLMGVCLVMCQRPHDCQAAAPNTDACVELPAPLTKLPLTGWPPVRTCLPSNQNLAVPLASPTGVGTLLVPATARSVTLVLTAPSLDETSVVGMSLFADAAGTELFGLWNPADPGGYFKNPIRHMPNGGSSIFLLSSSPRRAPLRMAPYQLSVFGQTSTGQSLAPGLSAIYKLLDRPVTAGKMPLRIHVTDLSGLPAGCTYQGMRASSAPTMLAPMVQRLREIYSQDTVQVELDPITYVDSTAPGAVDANSATSLGSVLAAASVQSGGGLDLVMIRSISPNGVLGIAGGIPGAPGLKGNPRTGAVMSMAYLCIPQANYGLSQLAQTAAHELGHTLGLSHNRESNGQIDPLGDDNHPSESAQQEMANLMYWAATSTPGQSLTTEQGQVIRSMPQVLP